MKRSLKRILHVKFEVLRHIQVDFRQTLHICKGNVTTCPSFPPFSRNVPWRPLLCTNVLTALWAHAAAGLSLTTTRTTLFDAPLTLLARDGPERHSWAAVEGHTKLSHQGIHGCAEGRKK